MALFLCDIDGTLTLGGSSYNSSMQRAIKTTVNRDIPVDVHKFQGYTDRLVLKQLFSEQSIPYNDQTLDRCLAEFGHVFPKNPHDVRVIPGVLETIAQLYPNHIFGLVTGNVEEMARKKLKMFPINGEANGPTLDSYFPFGGFGSDPHESRYDLVTLAVRRVKQIGSWTLSKNPVYIIDDAPRGIIAAREANVIPIGITTGSYLRQDLIDAGAAHVVDNFREIPGII